MEMGVEELQIMFISSYLLGNTLSWCNRSHHTRHSHNFNRISPKGGHDLTRWSLTADPKPYGMSIISLVSPECGFPLIRWSFDLALGFAVFS